MSLCKLIQRVLFSLPLKVRSIKQTYLHMAMGYRWGDQSKIIFGGTLGKQPVTPKFPWLSLDTGPKVDQLASQNSPGASDQRGWHQKLTQFITTPLSKGFLAGRISLRAGGLRHSGAVEFSLGDLRDQHEHYQLHDMQTKEHKGLQGGGLVKGLWSLACVGGRII